MEIYPREIKNYHIYSFVCISDEAGEQGWQETISEYVSYLVMYNIWGLSSARVLPFSFSLRFYSIRFIVHSDTFFYDFMRLLRYSASIAFMSPSFVYYLYMEATDLSP